MHTESCAVDDLTKSKQLFLANMITRCDELQQDLGNQKHHNMLSKL